MDLQFNKLDALHWLWLVAALAVVVVLGFKTQRRRLLRFASDTVLGRLLPTFSFGRVYARSALVLAALVSLVAALLDPRWGVTYEEVRQQGIDLIVALDVSRSMRAEDVSPNRLERAKQYILDLVAALGGDRVGLVTFAGTASLSCPLTVDYGAFALSLDEASPELAPRGGSLLGDALRLAGDSFTDDLKEYKAVIVFSDGEDHGSYPVEAARQLYEQQGVRVYTVGIGDPEEGALIPIDAGGRRTYVMHEGQQVWSRMDRNLLGDVALAANGAFFPAGTGDIDLGHMYEARIAPATKREFGTTRIERYHVRYQWFAGLALALLLVESLIGGETSKRRNVETPKGRKVEVATGGLSN